MMLSLILQIVTIGGLCVVPLVFTSVMPNMQMRSVIAAPPKPPALKAVPTASRSSAAVPRLFHLTEIVPLSRVSAARVSVAEITAPGIEGATNTGDPSGVPDSVPGLAPPPVPPPAIPTKPVAQTPKAIRVGSILASNLIHKVQPEYPPLAKATRVQGTVEFTATISRDGTIQNLTLVRGHPLLVNAAREAVLQWRYRPTLLNGEPVEVITDILVNFTLSQ